MEYLVHLGILAAIYAILALSLNLLVGFTGIVSFAHAAYFGIGAYATALLTADYSWAFWPAALVGVAAAIVLALVTAPVINRFKGEYQALVSLGVGVVVYGIFINLQPLTHGSLGVIGIARPSVFGVALIDNASFLVLALIVLGLTYIAVWWLTTSAFGRVLRGIREDEPVTQLITGINTGLCKLLTFTLAASLAALAGALFASYISYIDPSSFNLTQSIDILAIVIIGGLASRRGSVAAAIIFVFLPELLRFVGFPQEAAAQLRQLIYGLALVGLMLYRPQGLWGEYRL